jgi:hypothetical protein
MMYGNVNASHHLGTDFLIHTSNTSAVKKVKHVTDKMSYIRLRECRCDIIVLNLYASTEHKSDDMKESFYEKLERVFDNFRSFT